MAKKLANQNSVFTKKNLVEVSGGGEPEFDVRLPREPISLPETNKDRVFGKRNIPE